MKKIFSKTGSPKVEKALNEQINKMSEKEIKERAKRERTITIVGGLVLAIMFFSLCFLSILILGKEFDFSMVITSITMGAFGIWSVVAILKRCLKSDRTLAMDNIKSIIIKKVFNKEKNNILDLKNFNASKTVSLEICAWQQALLLIDDTKKQFVIQKGRQYSDIYDFTDVVGYEIFENNQKKVQGRAGSALIGGAFFGLGGAIVGSSRSRAINEKCNRLSLIIRIKDSYYPQIEIVFFDNVIIDKASNAYKSKINNARLICSHIEDMINSKSFDDNIDAENIIKEKNMTSKKEEMQTLKDMLDEGLITQEDFETKKKQILGI